MRAILVLFLVAFLSGGCVVGERVWKSLPMSRGELESRLGEHSAEISALQEQQALVADKQQELETRIAQDEERPAPDFGRLEDEVEMHRVGMMDLEREIQALKAPPRPKQAAKPKSPLPEDVRKKILEIIARTQSQLRD